MVVISDSKGTRVLPNDLPKASAAEIRRIMAKDTELHKENRRHPGGPGTVTRVKPATVPAISNCCLVRSVPKGLRLNRAVRSRLYAISPGTGCPRLTANGGRNH
jgi:hypothetical protein